MATDPTWQQDEKRRREAHLRAARQAQNRQALAEQGRRIAATVGDPSRDRYARLATLTRPTPNPPASGPT